MKKEKKETALPAVGNFIVKKDHDHIVIKFTEEDLQKQLNDLSLVLMQKHQAECLIEKSKKDVKDLHQKAGKIQEKIQAGGVRSYEEVELRIYPDTMIKETYYKGTLVNTEDADKCDLQTEIEEEEETEEEENEN